MIVHDHVQGSDEWLAARAGVVTASRFKDARDRTKPTKADPNGKPSAKCSGYAATVALERIKRGPVDKVFQNWQMKEGTEQEPFARLAYEALTGALVEETGFITTDDGLFGYSPDGVVDQDGLIEIKTILSAEKAVTVIGDGDISDYLDQCLGGLWLTGRKWLDLIIWCPALEPISRQLTVHRIDRRQHEDAIDQLAHDLLDFVKMVEENEWKLRHSAPRIELPLAA